MKLAEVLHDFLHHYDDRNAVAFTIPLHSRFNLGETIFDVLSAHPTACLPLTAEDFPAKQPRKPTVLSVDALERRQRRREERNAEKVFLAHELATANGAKFLDILEREKVHSGGYPGSRQETWIYVDYNGKRLGLGTYVWVVGDSKPYVCFSRVKI